MGSLLPFSTIIESDSPLGSMAHSAMGFISPIKSTRHEFNLVKWALNPNRKMVNYSPNNYITTESVSLSCQTRSYCSLQVSQMNNTVNDCPQSMHRNFQNYEYYVVWIKLSGQYQLDFPTFQDSSIMCCPQQQSLAFKFWRVTRSNDTTWYVYGAYRTPLINNL